MANWATAYDHEQITVSTTAVGFTATKYRPTSADARRATKVVVTVDPTNPIRYTLDGTTPTSSVGHYAVATQFVLEGYDNIKNFKAIRQGASDAGVAASFMR